MSDQLTYLTANIAHILMAWEDIRILAAFELLSIFNDMFAGRCQFQWTLSRQSPVTDIYPLCYPGWLS